MPFENGQPTPDEIERQKLVDKYLAEEAAKSTVEKIEEAAEQDSQWAPAWVWALATVCLLTALGWVASCVVRQ